MVLARRTPCGPAGKVLAVLVGLQATLLAGGRTAGAAQEPVTATETARCPTRIDAGQLTVNAVQSTSADNRGYACAPRDHAAAADLQVQGHAQQQQVEAEKYPSVHMSWFGDFNYIANRRREGSRGFTEGQLALHLVSQLSPRVTFFGEISLSARSDAGTGSPPATGFNAEVERSIIRFDQSDQLKVSFGRYHTPINWWNTAFHHGQWLQTTIARPEMIQFGGRLLPVHFVGGLVEGAWPARGWNINYKAGLGNGRASVISRAGDAGDSNNHRAWLVNVFAKPDAAFGLEFGGSAYLDEVTLPNAREFRERIVAAHVVWHKEKPELIAEVAGIRHREIGAVSAVWSRAYYVQAAYRLPWFGALWKPYYRFEHIGIDAADAVFQGVSNLDGSTLGVRYDLTMLAAVKGEFRTWRRTSEDPRNYGGVFQLCFTF